MRRRALELAEELAASPPPGDAEDVAEAREFLTWLEDHNFTFLGYRDYELAGDEGELKLDAVPGSGLGILRQAGGSESSRAFDNLPPAVRARALEPYLLNLTKANSRATVHRAAYLDYVGVKRFDAEGRVIGERRFLGLYTHRAYLVSPATVPILRRKVAAVLARAGFPKGSHNEKALTEILETYPRDELFQISVDELFELAIGILHLGERQRLRLFVRQDTFGRFVSCLVFVPRDRFNTENRRRIEGIIRRATGAHSLDYSTRVSESVLVRLHYLVYVEPGRLPDVDPAEIETLLVAATRSWGDDLQEALHRRARRGARHRALPPLRRRLPRRLPRRLGAALRPGRHPPDRGAERRGRARAHPLPPARGADRAAAREGLPRRRAAGALGHAAAVREHGRGRGRRAALLDHPARPRLGLDLRLRPDLRRRRRPGDRRRARGLPGRVHPRLARRGRERRLQPARAPGAPRLARDDRAARDRALPAPGRHHLQRPLRRAGAGRASRGRAPAGRAVPRALRPRGPRARRGRGGSCSASGRPSTPSRASTTTASCATSSTWCRRCCAPTTSSAPRTAPRSCGCPSSSTRAAPLAAAAAPALRDLRLLPARGGRAPARRQGGPRRAALVGPARGLPHRGARADEGADGQERRDRAGGRQGRLRGQAAAPGRRPRGAARRGGGLLPHVHLRAARPDRQHRGRRDRAAARRGAPRRRRPLPRGGRRQGHGHLLGHRQRRVGAVRLLARRRVRVRRLERLRPQEDGDHRARRLGVGQAPLPRARPRRPERGLHGGRRRRHVRRRVRQRHAAVRAHPAARRLRPPARLHRPRSRPRDELRRAPAPVRARRARPGTTTTAS